MTDSSATTDRGKTAGSTAGEPFERDVIFTPGFDKRSDVPSKNYGISGGRLTFILKGKKGAIQFMIGTGFYPPTAEEHLIRHYHGKARDIVKSMRPYGFDVGYHAHEPQYEGQEPMANECHVLGGKCYYDGSVLRAEEWLKQFLTGGTDWLWPAMELEYHERFHADETKG